MRFIFNKYKVRSEFSTNVLTLMTGTSIAQAIPIIIIPILTRIYTPSDFSLYAQLISISAIIAAIINARYESAIMLPEKDADSINLAALGMLIATGISITIFILIFFYNDNIITFLETENINSWIFIIPLMIWLIGLNNILRYLNTRKKYYRNISRIKVYKSTSMVSTQVVYGYIKSGSGGLVIGQIVSSIFENIMLLISVLKSYNLVDIKKDTIIKNAKKYLDFPKYNAPGALADIAAVNMWIFFVQKIAEHQGVIGYYFLARKIILFPATLIGRSISEVFYQALSERKNDKILCMPLLNSTLKKLLFISIPISIIGFLFSPYLFSLIFGEKWGVAGEIAQYFSLVFIIYFITSPVSVVFSVTGYIKRGAMWKYIYLITTSVMFLTILAYDIDFYTFLNIFVIHEYSLYIFYLFLIIKSVKQIDSQINNKL